MNNRNFITQNDKERNSLNYKTILCKNLEGKNKTCKYSALCSYVHGENELRKKYDNLCQTPLMIPNITWIRIHNFMPMDLAQMMGNQPVDMTQL